MGGLRTRSVGTLLGFRPHLTLVDFFFILSIVPIPVITPYMTFIIIEDVNRKNTVAIIVMILVNCACRGFDDVRAPVHKPSHLISPRFAPSPELEPR